MRNSVHEALIVTKEDLSSVSAGVLLTLAVDLNSAPPAEVGANSLQIDSDS